MQQPVERRLAAILAVDVVGYSRLMETDEELTLAHLRAHRRQLIDPKIREYRGRIVKTTGDGALVEFGSVVDAVRCAAEIQRGMLDREAETAEGRRIRFRIGVNLGNVIAEEGDIFGDGVNIAARLEALAEPGGICISQVVRDQVGGRVPYAFTDIGEQQLKNIARPLRAYALRADAVAALPTVAVAEPEPVPTTRRPRLRIVFAAAAAVILFALSGGGLWVWRSSGPPASEQAKPAPPLSIVVLPFENLSKDPGQEYFADGVTDDLTADLSRISGAFVISRTTAFTYKGKSLDVRQIGRDLGVRYVLEGSVRRSGDRVHVNVQLIDAESEAHVWTDQFDTDRRDLAEAQSNITARLASGLHVALVRDVAGRVVEQKRTDPDAQDLAMRGWSLRYRAQSPQAQQQARQAFEQALSTDPQSVDAKIGLAWMLLTSGVGSGVIDIAPQNQAAAERLLQEVLDREEDNASAHAAMGALRAAQLRLSEARIEFETALRLDPNNAEAARNLGWTLFWLGLPELAKIQAEKVLRLNPRDPFIFVTYTLLGACEFAAGGFAAAADFYRRSLAINPRLFMTHLALAAALAMQGDLSDGQVELEEAHKLKPTARSLAIFRDRPCSKIPACSEINDKTLFEGLRRLGFPEN